MDRRRILTTLGALVGLGPLAGCGARGGGSALTSEAPLAVRPAPTPYAAGPAPGAAASGRRPPRRAGRVVVLHRPPLRPASTPGGAEEEYGFELVFFRGVRGDRPPGYAAHFAVTDLPRQRFRYDQRVDVALNERGGPRRQPPLLRPSGAPPGPPQTGTGLVGTVALPVAGGGFDLALGGWRIKGREGPGGAAGADARLRPGRAP